MICPECHQGMIAVLATKGQIHPYRETSILTHPERYIEKVPCPRCSSSGIAYCCDGEDASQPDTLYGDQAVVKEARAALN